MKLELELTTPNDENGGELLTNIGYALEQGTTFKKDPLMAAKAYNGQINYFQACKWYRNAAEGGNSTGLFNYANMLHWGRGVRKNRQKAFTLFSQLMKLGYKGVAFYMGLYCQNGYAVSKNYDKAREYYRIGALEGDSFCFNQLGVLYSKGIGVKKDINAAIDYYLSAAKLGDALAYTNIGYLYEKGQGVKKDVNKALNWYRMAAL